MSDQTFPIEIYRDGKLIEARTAVVPDRAHPLEERLEALEERLAGVDADRLARLEERIARAVDRAATINPDAPSDPGTRGELAKVKQSLTPAETPPAEADVP